MDHGALVARKTQILLYRLKRKVDIKYLLFFLQINNRK